MEYQSCTSDHNKQKPAFRCTSELWNESVCHADFTPVQIFTFSGFKFNGNHALAELAMSSGSHNKAFIVETHQSLTCKTPDVSMLEGKNKLNQINQKQTHVAV